MSAASARRVALKIAVACGAGAALGVILPAALDPHIAWVRECFAARRRALELDDDAPEGAAAWAQFDELRDRIIATPATTLSGSLARLAVIGDYSFGCSLDEAELTPPVAEAMALLGVRDWSAP